MQIESVYNSAAGIDVHLNLLVVYFIRRLESGEVEILAREFGGFKRDRRDMAAWLASLHPDVVAMESTGIYWKSPYAALERVGIRAVVVNAQHIKRVPGRKTDWCDAQWLAMLARAGLLRGSFVPPIDFREMRLISRYHTHLMRTLGAEKNRLLKVLADGGVRFSALVSDPHGLACRQMVSHLLANDAPEVAVQCAGRLKADRAELLASLDHELTDTHRLVANIIQRHITAMEQTLSELAGYLQDALKPYEPIVALLLTVPGMDRLGIAKLLAETGVEMNTFARPDCLAAWAGLCPGNNESAGKRKRVKTRKGNVYARTILVEMANAAARTCCYLRDKYQSIVPRMGHKKAVVAIAHKMIHLVFLIIQRQQPYFDKRADFEAMKVKRNASRWIKALTKYNRLPAAA